MYTDMEKNISASNSCQCTSQLNAYYGIFYPIDLAPTVSDIIRPHSKYSKLLSDAEEVKIGKFKLIASVNSDDDAYITTSFIAVDNMTFIEPDSAESCQLDVDPNEMKKREKIWEAAVKEIEDLHTLIVREFNLRKLSLRGVYCGWRFMVCKFADSESESSSNDRNTLQEPILKKSNSTPNNNSKVNGKSETSSKESRTSMHSSNDGVSNSKTAKFRDTSNSSPTMRKSGPITTAKSVKSKK